VDEVSAGKTAIEKPDSKQPAKPAQQKADVQTLAYLLKEIDISLAQYKRGQSIAGGFMLCGGLLMCAIEPTAGLVVAAFGFAKLFSW
jgi:hypothetical protein